MKFWLRAESKPREERTPLTPSTCEQLLGAGKIIVVYCSLAFETNVVWYFGVIGIVVVSYTLDCVILIIKA